MVAGAIEHAYHCMDTWMVSDRQLTGQQPPHPHPHVPPEPSTPPGSADQGPLSTFASSDPAAKLAPADWAVQSTGFPSLLHDAPGLDSDRRHHDILTSTETLQPPPSQTLCITPDAALAQPSPRPAASQGTPSQGASPPMAAFPSLVGSQQGRLISQQPSDDFPQYPGQHPLGNVSEQGIASSDAHLHGAGSEAPRGSSTQQLTQVNSSEAGASTSEGIRDCRSHEGFLTTASSEPMHTMVSEAQSVDSQQQTPHRNLALNDTSLLQFTGSDVNLSSIVRRGTLPMQKHLQPAGIKLHTKPLAGSEQPVSSSSTPTASVRLHADMHRPGVMHLKDPQGSHGAQQQQQQQQQQHDQGLTGMPDVEPVRGPPTPDKLHEKARPQQEQAKMSSAPPHEMLSAPSHENLLAPVMAIDENIGTDDCQGQQRTENLQADALEREARRQQRKSAIAHAAAGFGYPTLVSEPVPEVNVTASSAPALDPPQGMAGDLAGRVPPGTASSVEARPDRMPLHAVPATQSPSGQDPLRPTTPGRQATHGRAGENAPSRIPVNDAGGGSKQAASENPWDLPQDYFLERYLQAALNEHPLSRHRLQTPTDSLGDDSQQGAEIWDPPQATTSPHAQSTETAGHAGKYDAALLESCTNPLFDSNASDIIEPGGGEVTSPPGQHDGGFMGHNRRNADAPADIQTLARDSMASSSLYSQHKHHAISNLAPVDGLRADDGVLRSGLGQNSMGHLSICSTADTFTRVSVNASMANFMDQQHAARIAELREYIQQAGVPFQTDPGSQLNSKALELMAQGAGADTAAAAAAAEAALLPEHSPPAAGAAAALPEHRLPAAGAAADAAAVPHAQGWIYHSGADRLKVTNP